jgi:hypothetical protein
VRWQNIDGARGWERVYVSVLFLYLCLLRSAHDRPGWWLTSSILITQKAEIRSGGSRFEASPGRVAQVAELQA